MARSSAATVAAAVIGDLLREVGIDRHRRARDDAGIGRQVVAVLAGDRLAIAAEIGVEKIALGARLALEGAELDAGVVGGGGACLELVEALEDLLLAGLGKLGVGLDR